MKLSTRINPGRRGALARSFQFQTYSTSSAANSGRPSAIADRLGALVDKKNVEITKMTDHFSHTQKKDFQTARAERSFFLLFYYSTPLKPPSEFKYTRNAYSPHSHMNAEPNWIAHTWKQFPLSPHETLRDLSL